MWRNSSISCSVRGRKVRVPALGTCHDVAVPIPESGWPRPVRSPRRSAPAWLCGEGTPRLRVEISDGCRTPGRNQVASRSFNKTIWSVASCFASAAPSTIHGRLVALTCMIDDRARPRQNPPLRSFLRRPFSLVRVSDKNFVDHLLKGGKLAAFIAVLDNFAYSPSREPRTGRDCTWCRRYPRPGSCVPLPGFPRTVPAILSLRDRRAAESVGIQQRSRA